MKIAFVEEIIPDGESSDRKTIKIYEENSYHALSRSQTKSKAQLTSDVKARDRLYSTQLRFYLLGLSLKA